MRLGVRRPESIPSSGTNEPKNDSNNYDDDSRCPSMQGVVSHVTVLAITPGGSPVITPVLEPELRVEK